MDGSPSTVEHRVEVQVGGGYDDEIPVNAAASTSLHSHPIQLQSHHQGQPHPKLTIFVLVGLVGSGKSTFAQALNKYDPTYIRSSQDVLGSRQAVESHLLSLLSRGKNAVVDRTNVTVDQRRNWLRLALQWQNRQGVTTGKEREDSFNATGDAIDDDDGGGGTASKEEEGTDRRLGVEVEVDAIYFDTGIPECTKRLMGRREHETIHSPDDAVRILNIFASQVQAPTLAEGFHKILILTPSDLPYADVSQEEVQAILQRLEEIPVAYNGGTRGALMGGRDRGQSRGGNKDARGRSYGWGALDRGRGGGRGGPSSTAREGDGRGRAGWRGRGQAHLHHHHHHQQQQQHQHQQQQPQQQQQTLPFLWRGGHSLAPPHPPTPPSLPTRPS